MGYNSKTMKKYVPRSIFFIATTLTLVCAAFFSHKVDAAPGVFYFNNAVDTSPATLGNYWQDSGHTVPAVGLPDFGVDEVTVLTGATFAGDGVFRGSAVNYGTVTGNAEFYDSAGNVGTVNGNATFYDDLSENVGIVGGQMIRYYTSAFIDINTYRDFREDLNFQSWHVVADNTSVDLTTATFDTTTTFEKINSGTFIYATILSAMVTGNTIILDFSYDVDAGTAPAAGDFVVTVNSSPVSVTNVSITQSTVHLTLASSVVFGDDVRVGYTEGTQPIYTLHVPVPDFSNQVVYYGVTSENNPIYTTEIGTTLYTTNLGDEHVTLTDLLTDTTLGRIDVRHGPAFISSVGNKAYFSINASVAPAYGIIDGTNNTLLSTNDVDPSSGPYFNNIFGIKFFLPLKEVGKIISVNTSTGVETTINTGKHPNHGAAVGYKYYVANTSDHNITVIDMRDDSISATISTGSDDPYLIVPAGRKVYATMNLTNKVVAIDTTTDSIVATITTGQHPVQGTLVGTKLYVYNQNSDNVTVINTTNDTVITTIAVGDEPNYGVVVGDKIYVPNRLSDSISIIDTNTDTVVDTVSVGPGPVSIWVHNNKLYIPHTLASGISIIDTYLVPSMLPALTSFSSSTSDGVYGEGDTVSITANFNKTLTAGSTMTVTLDTGASVTLNSVSGMTLTGTYTIGAGETTPDLAVTSITSASVSDGTHTRTSYSLPRMPSDLTAEQSMITKNLADTKNIEIGTFADVTVGTNPYQISAKVTVSGTDYVYVANQGAGTVSVVRLSDNTVVQTISVGSEPYGLTVATVSGTQYVYVANTGSDTMSVINTSTNTVAATIAVGVKPYYVEHVGTKIYVTNGASNTVSVINGATNTVTATIPVGNYPRGIKAHGTDLYVANYGNPNYPGGNYISVIDSTTDTVTDYIVLAAGASGPRGVAVLGSKVYVTDYLSDTVTIINTATNTISATVSVGRGPRGITGVGTDVYVENFDDGTISVIDTNTNTVTDTIFVGSSPAGMSVVGTDIYLSRFQDNKVSILDTATNTLREGEPVVTTGSASGVDSSSATLNGEMTIGTATSRGFEYGTSLSYGSTISTVGSYIAEAFSQLASGLSGGTTYHYRAFATNDFGTGYGSDATFSTSASGGGSYGGGPLPSPVTVPIQTQTPPAGDGGTKTNPDTPVTFATAYPNLFSAQGVIKSGSSNAILDLQKYLNNHGVPVATSGLGSKGKETMKFGAATRKALIKFQELHAKEILTPYKLKKGTGIFGPATKAYMVAHP